MKVELSTVEPGTRCRIPGGSGVDWLVLAQASDAWTRMPRTQVTHLDQPRWWTGILTVEPESQYARDARADADWLELCLFDEQGIANALAVFICDPQIRELVAKTDPEALEQAREALGLPETITV